MPRGRHVRVVVWSACALLAACGDGASQPEHEPAATLEPEVPALPALCARAGDDAVRDVFCAQPPAQIFDLEDLQQQLGIRFTVPNAAEPDGFLSVVQFSGHSTALSGRLVSPINPRVFFSSTDVAMAFQRGVQRVELAARTRDEPGFRFYLLSFRQACNDSERGCRPGDRYTRAIERDWRSVELQDDEQLANTASDCRQCHQRGRAAPQLLMRELRPPWTHFFVGPRLAQALGQATGGEPGALVGLAHDYELAKGDEPYANVPASALRETQPGFLQLLVDPLQPLLFDSMTIVGERGGIGAAPGSARSATWDAQYAGFKRGENLALPYFEERASDPRKQAALAQAYQRYQRGELDRDELPDLADVFPDDPQVRAEIGLQTEPDASPAQALVQACGSCHNDVLDQSLTRARFNIALDRMPRAQLRMAIERIERDVDEPGVMPPPEARQLDPRARAALVAYLEQDEHPADDLALLQRAAELGMAATARDPSW